MPKISINGTDRTEYYVAGTLRITSALNRASVGTFELDDITLSEYHPEVGHDVVVSEDGTDLIAGSIDQSSEFPPMGGPSNNVETQITVTTEEYAAERRYIYSRAWEDVTAGQIVKDIISERLSDEGISQGTIESGPTVPEFKVTYRKVSDVLEEVATKSGKRWRIDENKNLHFTSFDTTPAPWDLKPGNFGGREVEQGTFEVMRDRDKYVNRVIARGRKGVGRPRTETFTWPPDDTPLFEGFAQTIRRNFELDFDIEDVLWIRVNGVVDSEGGRASRASRFARTTLDGSGYVVTEFPKWMWTPGQKLIGPSYQYWDQFNNGDTIDIRYRPRTKITAVANNETEQNDRQTVEGGSGVYEEVVQTQIGDIEELKEFAKNRLQRFDQLGVEVRYQSRDSNLAVGMKQVTNLPRHNMTQSLIVTAIETQDLMSTGGLRRRIELLDESAVQGFEDSWSANSNIEKGGSLFGGETQDDELAVGYPGSENDGSTGDPTATDEDQGMEVAPATNNQIWVYQNKGVSTDTLALFDPGGNKVNEFDTNSVFSNSGPDDRGDILAVLDPGPSGAKELVMISPRSSAAASAARANIEDPTNPIFIDRHDITGSWSSGFQAPDEPNSTTTIGKVAFSRDGKIYVTYGSGSSGDDWLTDPAQKEVDVVDPSGWTVSNAYQRISVDESSVEDPFGLADEFGGILDLNTIYHAVNWFGDAAIYSQPWGGGTPSQFKGSGSLNSLRGYVMSAGNLWIMDGNNDTTIVGYSGWGSMLLGDVQGSADTNLSLNGASAFTPNEERTTS